MFTTLIQWFSVASFMGMMTFIVVEDREVQYNDYKTPFVEDKPTKSEPRPVYPPMKKKPYTRSTRLA